MEPAPQSSASSLDAILNPGSVAIIGASRDTTKRGHQIVRALQESDFRGEIHPVNPAGGELLGLAVATNIAELKAVPDLAVICTPAHTVPQVLRDCAAAGVRGAISLAVGFAESGDSGAALERELQTIVRQTGIRLAGPNTSGVLNTAIGLNLIGMRGVPTGPLALLVQSGNLTLQLVTEAAARSHSGFRYCIGVGNETDIRFDEYLEYVGNDPAVRAILVHSEGFRDGRAFVDAAAQVSRNKPIVVLKGARTSAGSRVALSHTGAIAGDYAVFQAAMRAAGCIELGRTDELFHVGQALAEQPAISMGKAIAILSDGGGHSALAVDAISHNAPLASLSESTQSALRALLGPAAAVQNPVDLAGAADGDPTMFARALDLLAKDPSVGGVLVVGLFGGYAIRFSETLLDAEQTAATSMCEIAAAQTIPLVVHSLYAGTVSDPLRMLMAAGVPVVQSLETACRCISALHRRGFTARTTWGIPQPRKTSQPNALAAAYAEKRSVLLEPEARELMTAAGVTCVPARWCRTPEEATAAANEFQGEVAIKAVSAAASHKTEAGGVALAVSPADAHRRFEEVSAAVRSYLLQHGQDADVRGALVTPMLPKPLAELLIGVRRDPQFGPILVVSAGGSMVELFHDSAINLLPLADPSAGTSKRTLNHALGHLEVMLSQIGVGRVLAGYRGQPSGDTRGITRVALALADLLYDHPEIESLEINPLFVYPDRLVAVDARGYLLNGSV